MAASSLGLMIGNSRLHWVWFEGEVIHSYDMPHLSAVPLACLTQQLDFAACGLNWPEITPPPNLPLWLASVIPDQVAGWQAYAQTRVLTLNQILLTGLYPTLGIDRALALLGAVGAYGAPCLVIDAGTALTFTGADAQGSLVGGAILPGLQLQLRALGEHTAALPQLAGQFGAQAVSLQAVSLQPASLQPVSLPERWSRSTADAILSGVLYSLLGSLREFVGVWRSQYPDSAVLITGGDATLLMEFLFQQSADLAAAIQLDSQLIFRGMKQVMSS